MVVDDVGLRLVGRRVPRLRARIADIERDLFLIRDEHEVLRERGRAGLEIELLFGLAAVARQPVAEKVLVTERAQAAHVHERVVVFLAAVIEAREIDVERLGVSKVNHRARRVVLIAAALAVNVPVEVERVAVSLKHVVEQRYVAVERFVVFFVLIAACRQVPHDENRPIARPVDFVHFRLDPAQRFVGVNAVVRVERAVGVDVDTDKVEAAYYIVERVEVPLPGLLARVRDKLLGAAQNSQRLVHKIVEVGGIVRSVVGGADVAEYHVVVARNVQRFAVLSDAYGRRAELRLQVEKVLFGQRARLRPIGIVRHVVAAVYRQIRLAELRYRKVARRNERRAQGRRVVQHRLLIVYVRKAERRERSFSAFVHVLHAPFISL